jgi:hypothetical protein
LKVNFRTAFLFFQRKFNFDIKFLEICKKSIKMMFKNKFSLFACVIAAFIFIAIRLYYSDFGNKKPLNVTTFDAFGYYLYLPAFFIYDDVKELKWLPEIDKEYKVLGGPMYQAHKHQNGNYVGKYLGGVAILETPFFFVGHFIAKNSTYKVDGFSPPYQYSIAFGAIFYCFLGLFFLRKTMLHFFEDKTVALSILLLATASNLVQYASVDSAQSHAYIFPLYALVIYTTFRWHQKPTFIWAILTGFIIGLATISLPTELIMLFIPLLWNLQNKESSKEKWTMVKINKKHIFVAVFGGFVGILPQLLYWKHVTGSFVYNVGSKWYFLNPFFRGLFGWEVGWFIYTPIAIFFILGLFTLKNFPFKKSFITFTVLNIWIIIAWSDWHYGGTFSSRALVQSYPIFAFSLAAFLQNIRGNKWRFGFYALAIYLSLVNLFQIYQYNESIIHYRDMNRKYYAAIYLDKNPTPLDFSLLDTDEILENENGFDKKTLFSSDTIVNISQVEKESRTIFFTDKNSFLTNKNEHWLHLKSTIDIQLFSNVFFICELKSGKNSKIKKFRLFNGKTKDAGVQDFEFYVKVPKEQIGNEIKISLFSENTFFAKIQKLEITSLEK